MHASLLSPLFPFFLLLNALASSAVDVRVLADGTLAMHTHDDFLSAWDAESNAPAAYSYTPLMEAHVGTAEVEVLMLGLGGGCLSAQLSRAGTRTRVLEADAAVVRAYEAEFAPLYARDDASVGTNVAIELADVFEVDVASRPQRVVAVDVPDCYRHWSARCVAMLDALLAARKRVVVNVYSELLGRVRERYGDAVVREDATGFGNAVVTLFWEGVQDDVEDGEWAERGQKGDRGKGTD